jgi:hypothetical protein
MITECIKEGFNLTNRNLPLVFVRIAVTIINLISIFIFLGIPVLVAVMYLGLDVAQTKNLLPLLSDNPFEFITKYLGLFFIIGISFMFYLIFVSTLLLYTLGGTLGILRNAAMDSQYRFNLSSFFMEANRNFFPLLRLISILLLGIILLLIAVGVLSGIGAAVVQFLSGAESTLKVFISSFITVSIVILGIIVFSISFVVIIYSIVTSVIERGGVLDSIKKTIGFLIKKPEAILFCILLFVGVVIINLVLFVLELPLGKIPGIGFGVDIILSLLSTVFHSYAAIVVWAALIAYYIKATGCSAYSEPSET